MAQICPLQANHTTQIHPLQASQQLLFECLLSPYVYKGGLSPKPGSLIKHNSTVQQLLNKYQLQQMTTHSNYSLQNFGTSNTRVLTGISQPVSEIRLKYKKIKKRFSFFIIISCVRYHVQEISLNVFKHVSLA